MKHRAERERYARMQIKNGWDLPEGTNAYPTGRKWHLARAYELLVARTEEGAQREKPKKQTAVSMSQRSVEGILGSLSKEEWAARRKKKRMIIAGAIVAIALVVGGRFALGPPILVADISSYEDVPIRVEGLTEKPFEITPGELAKMKKASIKVDVHVGELAEGEEPELGRAIGPTVETFLKKYGETTDNIRAMKVYSESERSTAYVRTLEEKEIVLSVANGRKPLGDKEAPLRIAVEDTDAGEWSGWIRKIVFTKK